MPDLDEHITFKELKAVRSAIQSFLPELQGKRLLLQEDNQSVIGVLTHLTSKSSTMMCELRKLFLLIDTYDIKIRTLYIRSAANVWADNLSRITDNSDWQLSSRKFKYVDKRWSSTRSTVSPRSPTSSWPPTTPSGAMVRRKQWTPFTCRTQSGEGKTIGATPHGSC